MRHHVQKRKLGRVRKQHHALLAALARSLILHGRIETTEAKARELRPYVEKLVTRARKDTLMNKRFVAAKLSNNKEVVQHLFSDLAPKYAERAGGYTRITKLPPRDSDGARMAVIEFV